METWRLTRGGRNVAGTVKVLFGVEVSAELSARWYAQMRKGVRDCSNSDWRFVVVGDSRALGRWLPEEGLDLYPAGHQNPQEGPLPKSYACTWLARRETSLHDLLSLSEDENLGDCPNSASSRDFEIKLAWTTQVAYRPCPNMGSPSDPPGKLQYQPLSKRTHRVIPTRSWEWEQLPGGACVNRRIEFTPNHWTTGGTIIVLCRLGSPETMLVPIGRALFSTGSLAGARPPTPNEKGPLIVEAQSETLENSKEGEEPPASGGVAISEEEWLNVMEELRTLKLEVQQLRKDRERDVDMLLNFQRTFDQLGEAMRWAYRQVDVSEKRYDEARYQATEALCEVVKLQAMAYSGQSQAGGSPPVSPTCSSVLPMHLTSATSSYRPAPHAAEEARSAAFRLATHRDSAAAAAGSMSCAGGYLSGSYYGSQPAVEPPLMTVRGNNIMTGRVSSRVSAGWQQQGQMPQHATVAGAAPPYGGGGREAVFAAQSARGHQHMMQQPQPHAPQHHHAAAMHERHSRASRAVSDAAGKGGHSQHPQNAGSAAAAEKTSLKCVAEEDYYRRCGGGGASRGNILQLSSTEDNYGSAPAFRKSGHVPRNSVGSMNDGGVGSAIGKRPAFVPPLNLSALKSKEEAAPAPALPAPRGSNYA